MNNLNKVYLSLVYLAITLHRVDGQLMNDKFKGTKGSGHGLI
jgi:hypothetical protein